MNMKKTCDNCYNNVMPRIGRILPMDECLENNPDYGIPMEEWFDHNGTNKQGVVCPKWVAKPKRRH
jgi:hypothetical protein